MRKLLATLGVATMLVLGVVVTDPAEALPIGQGYVVVNNSRCGAGKITGFTGLTINSTQRAVWTGGDWGDNIVWAKWDTNVQNSVYGWAWCDRPWWYPARDGWINVIGYFTPRSTTGTYWV